MNTWRSEGVGEKRKHISHQPQKRQFGTIIAAGYACFVTFYQNVSVVNYTLSSFHCLKSFSYCTHVFKAQIQISS